MTVSDLLSKLATKAGLNLQDAKYANLLAITTEFPEEDAVKLTGALLNLEDAKNNHDLKSYFKSQALDGADDEMKKLMSEMAFTPEDIAEMQAERNTYTRINKLTKKAVALEAKKAGATAGDKKQLQDEINRLNEEKANILKQGAEEKKQLVTEMNNKITNMTIRSILSGKKYANKELPQDVNVETAMVIANRKLESSGAKVVNRNGTLALVQTKDESLDWYSPSNEKLSVEQFLDGTLAESKMLAVNGADDTTKVNQQAYVPPVVNGGGGLNTGSYLSKLDQKIAEAERNVR